MKNIWKISGALSVVAVGLAGCGGGSNNNGGGNNGVATYTQKERLARPIVNEVLATVAKKRHDVNNKINPDQDAGELETDIRGFLKFPAGRSQPTIDFIAAVLVPDVMKVDLTQKGEAAYLGLETGGIVSPTKSTFGGRKLTDDVVDTSLGVVFGNTVTKFGIPDDGQAAVNKDLLSDNVGSSGHNYSSSFPYLEAPNR